MGGAGAVFLGVASGMTESGGLPGFIEMVALAFTFVAVERFADGKFLQSAIALTIAVVLYLVQAKHLKIKQKGRWAVSTTLLMSCVLIGLFWWSVNHHAGFVLLYQGRPLNGQTVPLIVRSASMTGRECRMFIDLNNPTLFVVPCIVGRNDGDVTLQPDAAYLSFNAPIQKFQLNAPGWQPLSSQSSGWTTFGLSFYRGGIDPEHAVALEDFIGTPVPRTPIRAKITLMWGRQETSAEFAILPPAN